MTERPEIQIEDLDELSDDISEVSWLDIPVLLLFVSLILIVGAQFFTRYVLNDSLGWTEEIARYFLIAVGFVGSISAVRQSKHIELEFLTRRMPAKVQEWWGAAVLLIVSAFWTYLGVLAIELAQRTRSNMVSIEVPKAYLYYLVAVSCFLMGLFAVVLLVKGIRAALGSKEAL